MAGPNNVLGQALHGDEFRPHRQSFPRQYEALENSYSVQITDPVDPVANFYLMIGIFPETALPKPHGLNLFFSELPPRDIS